MVRQAAIVIAFFFGVPDSPFAAPETNPFVSKAIRSAALTSPPVGDPSGFGASTDVDGNWMVIGAPYDGGLGDALTPGAAYVYQRVVDGWELSSTLQPATLSSSSQFGWAVTISNDTLAVSAPNDTSNPDRGRVYVFQLVSGVWDQVQILDSTSDGRGNGVSRFGQSLDLVGDELVIGEYFGNPNGQALVYVRTTGSFTLEQTLIGPDLMGDMGGFGFAVALAGTQLLIGDPFLDTDNAGQVAVYERVLGVWQRVQEIDGTNNFENFGISLDVAGDLAAAGSEGPFVDVLTRTAGVWTRERIDISGPDWVTGAPNLDFSGGMSVSITAGRLLVGAPFSIVSGESEPRGAVKVLEESAGAWTQTAFVTGDRPADNFGYAVHQDTGGDLIGARFAQTGTGEFDGLVRVGDVSAAATQTLGQAIFEQQDGFGSRVAMAGELSAVSAPSAKGVRNGVRSSVGKLHVFSGQDANAVHQAAALTESDQNLLGFNFTTLADTSTLIADASVSGGFAESINIYDLSSGQAMPSQRLDTANANYHGAARNDVLVVAGPGGVDVYERDGVGTWGFDSNLAAAPSAFGTRSADTDGVRISLVSRTDCMVDRSVEIFGKVGASWVPEATLPGSRAGDSDVVCAEETAIDGDLALVGYYSADFTETQVILFDGSGGAWVEAQVVKGAHPRRVNFSQTAVVATESDSSRAFVWRKGQAFDKAENLNLNGGFVSDIGVNGNIAIIGDGAGQAFLFDLSAADLGALPVPADSTASDRFGASVATDGNLYVAGRPGADGGTGDVIIYRVEGGSLVVDAMIEVPADRTASGFGSAVALDANRLLVGTQPSTQTKGLTSALQVALFERTQSGWTKTQDFASDRSGDDFGTAVDLDGSLVVIGAPGDDEGEAEGSGAVHLFRLDEGDNLTATLKIKPADAEGGEQFGGSVASSGSRLAVGAPKDVVGQATAGTVHLFAEIADNLGSLVDLGAISGDMPADGDEFGAAVALDAETMVVGASGEDGGGNDRGAVYVYDGSGFALRGRIEPDQPRDAARFGRAVATAGGAIAVGAPGFGENGALFQFGSNLTQTELIEGGAGRQELGLSVDISETGLIAGAPTTDAQRGAAILQRDPDLVFSTRFE